MTYAQLAEQADKRAGRDFTSIKEQINSIIKPGITFNIHTRFLAPYQGKIQACFLDKNNNVLSETIFDERGEYKGWCLEKANEYRK